MLEKIEQELVEYALEKFEKINPPILNSFSPGEKEAAVSSLPRGEN